MKLIYVIIAGVLMASCAPTEKEGGNQQSESVKKKELDVKKEKKLDKKEEEKRYVNDKFNVSVVNIQGWEIKEDKTLAFLSPLDSNTDILRENVRIAVEDAPGYTLETYYKANLDGVKLYLNDFSIIKEPVDTQIKGHEFLKMTYEFSTNGVMNTVLVYFAVKDGKGYVLNGTALKETYSEYKPKFEKLIESFRFE